MCATVKALNTSFWGVLSQVQLSSWVQTHLCCLEASSWRKLEGRFLPSCFLAGAVPLAHLTAALQVGCDCLCLLSHHPGLHPGPDLLAQLSDTCPNTPWTCWEITGESLTLATVFRPNASPDSSLSTLAPCCDGHLPCYNVGLPANLHWWSSQIFLPHSNTCIKTNSFNQ